MALSHHHHRHAKTQSIPIQQPSGSSARRHRHSSQQEEHEMMVMADYADYVFCERLVSGMQRKVSSFKIRDVALRYENQALIDHIIATRRSSSSTDGYDDDHHHLEEDMSPPSSPPVSPALRPRIISRPHGAAESASGGSHQFQLQQQSVDDDMIFDMEL